MNHKLGITIFGDESTNNKSYIQVSCIFIIDSYFRTDIGIIQNIRAIFISGDV
jgi:hypothetical protein